MKNKMSVKRFYPHLIAFLGFVLLTFIYASPLLQGKRLAQHDSVQAKAAAQEVLDYRAKTGKQALWTNSIFGGMPAYMIASDYPNSLSTHLGRMVIGLFPEPANLILLYLVGFYILMMVLGVEVWLGFLGAVAFAFCSYNFISIEAGHVSKVIAIAYAPAIFAGVILCYRGRYLAGAALTALFLGLQIYGNHLQITYYTFLALGIYGIFELVWAVRENRLKGFVLASVVLVGAGLIAAGTHASRLWTTYEYSRETTRGKSELTLQADSTHTASTQPTEGLGKDYAFQWSYGIGETMTFLIPNFYGGSTYGSLSPSSNTYKTLTEVGASAAEARQFVSQLPLYWGDQPMTGGPAYAGAIVCFLFVLGMFVVRHPIKWWALAVAVFFTVLAWGKNFEAFNYFMFDYFPLYNKFRAVTMLLNLVQIFMVMIGIMGLQEIVRGGWKFNDLKQPLLRSLAITGGLCLIFALAGGLIFNFGGQTEERFFSQLGNPEIASRLISSIRDDRASLLRTDAIRSLVFILLATTLIWLFSRQKIKPVILYAGLILLVVIDMFAVDKRYFNNEDFKRPNESALSFAPSPVDQQILQDKDLSYRVYYAPSWYEASPAYFHKLVGGYHGARMSRYEELFNFQISRNNMAVLDMLNTRYFILPNKEGQLTVQRNPGAMGNAWFVDSYRMVANANEEMKALDDFDPRKVAFVDRRFEDQLKGFQPQPDSTASIRLSAYAPDQLTYESNARSEQLAIFSENYYNGNTDWQAYIDGKPTPHFRANYVLRAMRIPAGKHTIEFKFEPRSYYQGETLALVCSILMVGLLGAAIFLEVRGRQKEAVPA
jgi:hypothetical protein